MALNAFLKIKGAKQGEIKGSVVQKGREGKITVIAFQHELNTPQDVLGRQTSGKRMHKPFVITKELDKSTPLFYNALIENETITDWELQCFTAQSKTGTEANYYTIKLHNVKVMDIKSTMPNNKDVELANLNIYEEIAFTYTKIEWIWVDGGITAIDDIGQGA